MMKLFADRHIRDIGILSIAAVAFVCFHMILNQSVEFWYLPWNLLLAWVPLVIAAYLVSTPLHRYIEISLLVVWLVFLPNTFYVMTDIIHINDQVRFNQTYDVLTIMMSVIPSVLAGLVSLALIDNRYLSKQPLARRKQILAAIALSSAIAIYIGRELRWNSWDLFANPINIVTDMVGVLISAQGVAHMTLTVLAYTIVIVVLYGVYKRTET